MMLDSPKSCNIIIFDARQPCVESKVKMHGDMVRCGSHDFIFLFAHAERK